MACVPAHWCPRVEEGVGLFTEKKLYVVKHYDAALTFIIFLNKKSVWDCQIDGFKKFDINSILLNLPLLLGLAF